MKHDPDIYLLYEYMDKVPFTVRMKVVLDAPTANLSLSCPRRTRG